MAYLSRKGLFRFRPVRQTFRAFLWLLQDAKDRAGRRNCTEIDLLNTNSDVEVVVQSTTGSYRLQVGALHHGQSESDQTVPNAYVTREDTLADAWHGRRLNVRNNPGVSRYIRTGHEWFIGNGESGGTVQKIWTLRY